MKFILLVVVLAVALVGCEKLEGQFNVSTDLKLKNSKGDIHLIAPGSYTADLDKKTFSKKIVLRLNNDSDEKFEFKIPDGASIPDNGTFELKAAQIGQAVDLKATIATATSRTNIDEQLQSCTYNEPYVVCSPAGPNGQVVCSTYYRTVFGNQWIRYYDETTDKNIQLEIYPVSTAILSAEFTGSVIKTQRVIINQTPCR